MEIRTARYMKFNHSDIACQPYPLNAAAVEIESKEKEEKSC